MRNCKNQILNKFQTTISKLQLNPKLKYPNLKKDTNQQLIVIWFSVIVIYVQFVLDF